MLVLIISYPLLIASSLDKNLDENDFKHLIQDVDGEVIGLDKQKGFFSMNICLVLPGKNEFHSSLSCKGISDKGCQHLLKVWNKFAMKMIKDYHNVHLECDVFEKFRNRCIENHGLYPEVMLSMTKVKLDRVSDVDMYLFFEKEIRGTVCYI